MLQEPAFIDATLRALAEPRRREILRLLQAGEMTSGAVASHFDVTGPAISQHLKVLEEAQLIGVRRSGTKRLYRTKPGGLVELRGYLADFWTASLRSLAAEAEAEEQGSKHAGAN